jgi:hypothetical protein
MPAPFKIVVTAGNVVGALRLTEPQHGRSAAFIVNDTLADVLAAVEAKAVRARENPTLYADKIAEYERIVSAARRAVADGDPEALVVVDTMIAHGDSRVNERGVAIKSVGDGRYIVFGVA